MLHKLRLEFLDRPCCDLAFEPSDEETDDPWELLRRRADDDGRITLGDRESCVIEDVVEVSVKPTAIEGPTWERGLQDEDAATALDEDYEPPS